MHTDRPAILQLELDIDRLKSDIAEYRRHGLPTRTFEDLVKNKEAQLKRLKAQEPQGK
jgi:hypothetical protein